jgi:hypothetical protein
MEQESQYLLRQKQRSQVSDDMNNRKQCKGFVSTELGTRIQWGSAAFLTANLNEGPHTIFSCNEQ